MSVRDPIITCFLTFSSPGPAVLAQGFKVNTGYSDNEGEDNEEFEMNLGERHAEIFSQASMTIRTHLSPEFRDMTQPDAFPPITKLTITQPSAEPGHMTAVVELAKSQYALGVSFEYVAIRMKDPPLEMMEWLSPWVGVAYYCGEDDG